MSKGMLNEALYNGELKTSQTRSFLFLPEKYA